MGLENKNKQVDHRQSLFSKEMDPTYDGNNSSGTAV